MSVIRLYQIHLGIVIKLLKIGFEYLDTTKIGCGLTCKSFYCFKQKLSKMFPWKICNFELGLGSKEL